MAEEKIKLIQGDCLIKLKELEDNSIDSIVTDPPYEIGFMGKSWDSTGIANNIEMWKECLRVLKPGGHLLAFSGSRTYHRMASAIEDAGFEVRDMIEWVYGSGFPKSLNIAYAIEGKIKISSSNVKDFKKLDGEEYSQQTGYVKLQAEQGYRPDYSDVVSKKPTLTTEQAKQWEGWGTALKPAHEPICMARKPLSEKTVAENCLKWGTGGINIDESRVENSEKIQVNIDYKENNQSDGWGTKKCITEEQQAKRFPANLIHDNSEEVRECFPNENERFFKSIIYQAKSSKSERNMGLDVIEENNKRPQGEAFGDGSAITEHSKRKGNFHPTVKPIALMEYLIKMVTHKSGIVLDPFMGSGTTGIACKNLNRRFIGIELDEKYFEIAKNRILI